MNSAEEKFVAENGMSSKKALEYIYQWEKTGQYEQVQKGCEELLRFFPENHEVQMILRKVQKETPEASKASSHTETPASLQKKKKALDKIGGMLKSISPDQNSLPGMEKPRDDERILAALCYMWFFVLVPLFLKRDSNFVQFHAWQGLTLTLFIYFFKSVVTGLLRLLEQNILIVTFNFALTLLFVGVAVMAYQGKWVKIPGIYPISEKLRKMF